MTRLIPLIRRACANMETRIWSHLTSPLHGLGRGLARIAALSRSKDIRAQQSASRRISHQGSNRVDCADFQVNRIAVGGLEIGYYLVWVGAGTFHRRFDLFANINEAGDLVMAGLAAKGSQHIIIIGIPFGQPLRGIAKGLRSI